jgi:hypothetical protein
MCDDEKWDVPTLPPPPPVASAASRFQAAVATAYDDCIAVAKDFTGQGVLIGELLLEHKEKALSRLRKEASGAR